MVFVMAFIWLEVFYLFWISCLTQLIGAFPTESSPIIETHDVGQVYVNYFASTGLPVILSAPHGGSLQPGSIPDRDAGCWDNGTARCVWNHSCGQKDFTRCKAITVEDLYTKSLTKELRERLCALFRGACPAAVLNLLDRRKFDANRDVDEATFDVPEVVMAFNRYHRLIDNEKSRIGGVGLFVDIHGHGHPVQRAELGYLPRGKDLDSGDPIDPNSTSIRTLAGRSHVKFDDLLRGPDSFGAFLGAYGFDSVPSPKYRGPGNLTYFNGGYNTRRHGSLHNGSLDAIQIESARSHRDPSMRSVYVRALACTIRRYYCQYYHPKHIQTSVGTEQTMGNLFERLTLACDDERERESGDCTIVSSGDGTESELTSGSVYHRVFHNLYYTTLIAFLLIAAIC